jgi:putative protease
MQRRFLMPVKAGGKSKEKKAVARKPAAKTVKKKALKKKSPPRKKAAKKKTLKKKVAIKTAKKAAKKIVKKKAVKKAAPAGEISQEILVEPGPPPRPLPPLEEPASNETAIGTVTHYYSHLSVAVVQINQGELRTGNAVHFKGHSTDFIQTVESMEFEHRHVDQAVAGQSIGVKVTEHTREHDIVYLMK